MEELKNKWLWVTWHFEDGSKRHVYTTLSEKLLNDVGASLKEGFMFDKIHREYVPFRGDAVEVTVSPDKPVYSEEVLNFVSKFI